MTYNYYQPSYYPQTNGLEGYGATSYKPNHPHYYATPTFSATSDADFQYNPAVSNAWLNTGTNASINPYDYSAGGYYANPAYNTYQYAQENPKTFTQQSSKSQAMSHSETSSQLSQMQLQTTATTQPQVNDDLNQLTPQIEAAYEAVTGKRRQPVVKRQVITLPGVAGRVQQVVRRLPTPTPDVIERVFIVKPQRDTVNLIIERPATPPVQYKDKTVYGKQRRPLINPKIVTVPPRSVYQQQQIEYSNQEQPLMLQPATASMAFDAQFSEKAKGYLISPVKYDETNNAVQTYTQLENGPTYSQNILQPYNPLENYGSNLNYMGMYQSQPQTQYSSTYGLMNY